MRSVPASRAMRPSPSPPRAGTGAARWEAVSSRPNQLSSLPDAPKRRRQSPPRQTHSRHHQPLQTTASHRRTKASVADLASPLRPPPLTTPGPAASGLPI